MHKIPVSGLVLLLGVDRFLNEARAVTNLIGNSVATIVVGRWEGAFDTNKACAVLDHVPSANALVVEGRHLTLLLGGGVAQRNLAGVNSPVRIRGVPALRFGVIVSTMFGETMAKRRGNERVFSSEFLRQAARCIVNAEVSYRSFVP